MNELDIVWRLGLALVLSSLIGLEREVGQKSAGLRTYTLVGVGAAVFMLVSIYGFSACGGDLPLIAVATTAIYMLVAFGYPFLVRVLPRSRFAPSELRLVYVDGRGLLREASPSAPSAASRSQTSRSNTSTTASTTATTTATSVT